MQVLRYFSKLNREKAGYKIDSNKLDSKIKIDRVKVKKLAKLKFAKSKKSNLANAKKLMNLIKSK